MTREEIAAVGAHMANFGHLMAYNNFPDNRMKEVADNELDKSLPFPIVAINDDNVLKFYYKCFVYGYFTEQSKEWKEAHADGFVKKWFNL